MKFPRHARIFRGQLDAAPFAAVFFLLVIFLMLGSLVYTPGVHIQLPVADGLAGTDQRTIPVAMDANGLLYFENQWIQENELSTRLRKAVTDFAPEPLALVVQADRAVPHEMIVRLATLAQEAGISNAILAVLPPPMATPGQRLPP
jgi:biopolymer transport protein ExbD